LQERNIRQLTDLLGTRPMLRRGRCSGAAAQRG
jgi:hypothetical protein